MAITFKIREAGGREVDLVYDATTQAEYQMWKGSQSLNGPVNPRFHLADNAPPQLISLVPDNRLLFFRLNVAGTSADDTLNDIIELARLIDGGETQQAARYWLDGDVPRVELVAQMDGATNPTIFPVVYGELDTLASLFSEFGEANAMAHDVPVSLVVTPEGNGNTIVLRNELPNSPHMLHEGSTAGLAAGLTLVGTPTSYALDAQYGLIKQSQKMTVPASGSHGFKTATVTAPPGTNAEAYAWIYQDSGDPITVTLYDGSNNVIQSKEYTSADSYAAADITHTDYKGNTWRRVRVSGVNTSAAGFYLSVTRDTADATGATTWWTDLLYLTTTEGGNLIPNPLMDVDDNADGIVDGWVGSGTASYAISSVFYFSTAKSQEVGDGAGTTRLGTTFFYDTTKTLTVSAWIRPVGGTGTTNFYLRDEEDNILDSKTIVPSSPSGYERTATGDDGNTWYKYALTYGLSGPRPQYAKITFEGTANQCYVDNVTAFEGSLTPSPVWISSRTIYNRHDVSTANPERINTIDLWNVPGDAAALITLKFKNLVTAATLGYKRLFLAARTDGEIVNPDFVHWYDSTTLGSSTGTAQSDAARSGGSYRRFTSTASFLWTIDDLGDLKQFCANPRRVFAIARSTSTSNSLKIASAGAIVFPADGENVTFPVANEWVLLDLGTINGVGLHNQHMTGFLGGANTYHRYTATVASGNVEVDAIVHLPVERNHFLFSELDGGTAIIAAGYGFTVDGEREQCIAPNVSAIVPSAGQLWHMTPGTRATRIYWLMSLGASGNGQHYLGDTFSVTVEVIPRSRHLLGTI